MGTGASGRVVRGPAGAPWVGLTVTATDISAFFGDTVLGRQRTGADGRYGLAYAEDGILGLGPRRIRLRVTDRAGRELARTEFDDDAAGVRAVPDVVVRPADGEGFAVTLGTGVPAFVSSGNAVSLLIDNVEAWERITELLTGAQSSVEMMQMELDVPAEFHADPAAETPVIVLAFTDPAPTQARLRPTGPGDDRPERLLLERAAAGVDVRILISQPVVDGQLTLLGGVLIPVVGALIVRFVGGLLQALGIGTSADEVKDYFAAAGQPRIEAHGIPTPMMGPTHGKLVIVDGREAVSLGSPFMQSYFGGWGSHRINDPQRGDADGHPIHDVSMAVRGPAVAHLHEAFRLHWNIVKPGAPIPAIPAPPPAEGGDGVVTLQVVRTLKPNRFPEPAAGEMGVLEAYLRAIAAAERLIYLENQYFTNDPVADALIAALQDPERPGLEVILLINIDPDVPGYPGWQTELVKRVRTSLDPAARARFGVFTRWTHEPGPPRPRIVPDYVHTKVGIVDDRWATVGSANLDGASLDHFQLLHALQPGADIRNTEVNLLVLPDPGQLTHPVVERLRRRLWAEHLGFVTPAGGPDPDVAQLAGPPPAGGWLPLWNQRAQAKADLLRDAPMAFAAGSVLAWPTVDEVLDSPRAHLRAVIGAEPQLEVVKKTLRYDFKLGAWSGERELDS